MNASNLDCFSEALPFIFGDDDHETYFDGSIAHKTTDSWDLYLSGRTTNNKLFNDQAPADSGEERAFILKYKVNAADSIT